jgi:hypothetical protein
MHRTTRARPARPLSIPLGVLTLAACAAPPRTTLDVASAEASVARRGAEPGVVDEALALVDLGSLSLPAPSGAALADARRPEFWRACAWTWNPDVRRARRALLATRAEAASAGAPEPLALQLVDHEFGGDDELLEAVAVFDLIGLLGLGPARAARELAGARSLAALGSFEETLWRATIDVERARLALAAARARVDAFTALVLDARADQPRVEVLARNGRLADAEHVAARGRVHSVERALSSAREAEAAARRELARAAGLPPASTALDVPGAAHLVALAAREPAPSARLADTHPALRARRLEFALAEARVRRVAADAWPGVGLGPHVAKLDGLGIGGVLQLSLPWPSAWRGRLAAAQEERAAAREAFEDALVGLLADERAAAERHAEARLRAARHTPAVEAAGAADWRAARARFRVAAAGAGDWQGALGRRADTLTITIDDQELAARAALDLLAARGPAALEGAP